MSLFRKIILCSNKEVSENAKLYYKANNKLLVNSTNFDAPIIIHNYDETNGEGCIIFSREITTIKNRAFYKNSDILNIVFPETLTTIEDYAFCSCINLEYINLHKNIKNLGNGVFKNCKCDVFIDCEIPTKVVAAVFNNANLKNVTYGENVTEVYKDIFLSTTIENLHISKTIELINTQYYWKSGVSTSTSIRNAKGLTIYNSISVDDDNPIYKSVNNCLIEKNTNTLCFGCNNSIIPEEVTKINYFAFFNNVINELTLSKNITSFGYIKVSGSVLNIDMDLSKYYLGLKGLTYQKAFIGDNVTTIGEDGLNDAKITRLIINKNVTYINPRGVYDTISFIDLRAFDQAFNIFNESSTTVHTNLTATFIVPDELYDAWATMPCIRKLVKSSEYTGV